MTKSITIFYLLIRFELWVKCDYTRPRKERDENDDDSVADSISLLLLWIAFLGIFGGLQHLGLVGQGGGPSLKNEFTSWAREMKTIQGKNPVILEIKNNVALQYIPYNPQLPATRQDIPTAPLFRPRADPSRTLENCGIRRRIEK